MPDRQRLGAALHYLVLGAGAFLMLVPLLWMVTSSFKSSAEIFAIPMRWLPEAIRWENYVDAWQTAPFGRFFFNSLLVSGIQTGATVFLGALAGYGFAKFRFPGRNLIFFVFVLSTILISFEVIMVPLFVLTKQFGWVDTYYGLIVPGAVSAIGVFLMRQFMMDLPNEILDAARVDGTSELRIFFRIVLPMTRPAQATVAIITFLASWDLLLWPLVVTSSEDLFTLPLGLSTLENIYGGHGTVIFQQLLAMGVLASLPALVVFLVFQRQIIQSITRTGLGG